MSTPYEFIVLRISTYLGLKIPAGGLVIVKK
jgi:hypothetical protein